MSNVPQKQETTFACDIFALTSDERVHHAAASEALFADVQEIGETANGYTFRFPQESAMLPRVALSHSC